MFLTEEVGLDVVGEVIRGQLPVTCDWSVSLILGSDWSVTDVHDPRGDFYSQAFDGSGQGELVEWKNWNRMLKFKNRYCLSNIPPHLSMFLYVTRYRQVRLPLEAMMMLDRSFRRTLVLRLFRRTLAKIR